jgi:AbiV family abortive infection protein
MPTSEPPDIVKLMNDFAASLTAEDIAQAQRKIKNKDAIRRFTEYTEILNQAIRAGGSVLTGEVVNNPERFRDLIAHVDRLWGDAVHAYFRGRNSTSLFLSIVVLEETGKVGVLRFVLALSSANATGPMLDPLDLKRSKNPLYSHTRKHLLAAGAGAIVNSRLDRVLGENAVIDFLEKTERGEIEELRQACIYTEDRKGTLYIPDEKIDQDLAKHYLILAGEIMAEVLGWVPDDFHQLLERVKQVELRLGLDPSLVTP